MELEKKIVLFDGVCNLCNQSVLWIVKRDKKGVYLFAALQSDTGKTLVKERNIDTTAVDSIILIEPGIAYYTRSTAALKIGISMGGGWKLLYVLTLIPRELRDIVYDYIAKNRYRWYGKKDACMVPTPELRSRFLDN